MASVQPLHAGTLKRLMAGLAYFKDWDSERIRAVEAQASMLDLDAEETLLDVDAVDPYAYFLIDGGLSLSSIDGDSRSLGAGELDAGFPVAHLRPSRYRVNSVTPAKLLRLEASTLKRFAEKQRTARFQLTDTSVGGSWQNHALVTEFMQRLEAGTVELPSLPSVALKIRRALASDDFDMSKLATIVGADPGIAAQLLKVVNSALFRAENPCDSVQAALVRLGVEKTQNFVTSLALKGLYAADKTFIKKRLVAAWQHAVEIAALTVVLARLSPGLAADRALLVGLLHEIGAIPILKMAADHADLEATPGLLDEIVAGLAPRVSAMILEAWDFPEHFADAALNAQSWFREADEMPDYTDLVVVAHLHALVRRRAFELLPRLDETPAFRKLAVGNLSPQLSMLVLDESKTQIQELRSVLG